ncbi:hypothetical protein D9X30_3275 [Cupriavidus sp. U2]|uniref:PHA-granule associated protein 4 n=1 Tax=Cupriavidus sp. U2 TaxID=2920269 RepID=UPI00129DF6AD|nr:PHA-granule associated protein 4 [Cupriavidus sp. U2]KAI3591750.1 hypothetical protein D9X30_3275 [Cupriavidus sp. U2]
MTRVIVRSKAEAIKALRGHRGIDLELDYASAWRDTAELSRLGLECNVRVLTRGVDNILVVSSSALESGLSRAKSTYRQRNLYCSFEWSLVSDEQLTRILRRAVTLGDRLLGIDQLTGMPNETWV